MWLLLLAGVALAAPPPAHDDPSLREWDWPAVHDRAVNTAHASQAAGAASATAVAVGIALTYSDADFGGAIAPNPRGARIAIGLGAGGIVFTSAMLNGSALRARHASAQLGHRQGAGPGYVGWAFTGVSAAAWVTTAALVARDGEMPGPALPMAAAVAGAGGWVAGTIQLALDKQAQSTIRGHEGIKARQLRLWVTPTGLGGQF